MGSKDAGPRCDCSPPAELIWKQDCSKRDSKLRSVGLIRVHPGQICNKRGSYTASGSRAIDFAVSRLECRSGGNTGHSF